MNDNRKPTGAIVHAKGADYRIERVGKRWTCSICCDCALGPHWHEIGKKWDTKTAMYREYFDWSFTP